MGLALEQGLVERQGRRGTTHHLGGIRCGKLGRQIEARLTRAVGDHRVREILRISQDPLSLDSPVGEEDDSNLADFIEDLSADAPADSAE